MTRVHNDNVLGENNQVNDIKLKSEIRDKYVKRIIRTITYFFCFFFK